MNRLSGILPSRSFKHKCEWCGKEYLGTSFSVLCSRKCMYEQRKSKNWETAICKHCGKEFKRRIADRNWRSGKKKMFCSIDCSCRSDYKRNKLSKRFSGNNNPWARPEVVEKIKQTKLSRYGTTSYNNQQKSQSTMLKRYGVHCPFQLSWSKSNGHQISNVQRKVYKEVKKVHKDALLEHYLPDVKLSVDIFIPKTKQVIEVFGDYWHMNPDVYKKNDFNKNTHLTAQETWEKDKERVSRLQSAGYNVDVVWENATLPTS